MKNFVNHMKLDVDLIVGCYEILLIISTLNKKVIHSFHILITHAAPAHQGYTYSHKIRIQRQEITQNFPTNKLSTRSSNSLPNKPS